MKADAAGKFAALIWRSEAQRRLAELENGTVQGVPLEDTLAKARALLGR